MSNELSNAKEKLTIVGVVNLIGSIASITGVSLLWLRTSTAISPLDLLWFAFVVTFLFGVLALEAIAIRWCFYEWIIKRDWLAKFAFFALVIPIAAAFLFIFGAAIVIYAKAFFHATTQ